MRATLLLALTVAANARAAAQECHDVLAAASLAVAAISAVVDIASASQSAEQYNRRIVSLVPLADPNARRYGLALRLSHAPSATASRSTPEPMLPLSAPTRKSPTTAFALSALFTAVPMAAGVSMTKSDNNVGTGFLAFLGGGIVGPSIGHFYARHDRQAWAGIAIRLAGTVAGIGLAVRCIFAT